MTPSELGTVAGRVVGVPDGGPPMVVSHEEIAALRLAAFIGDGDQAAARRFAHELEHGLTVWTVDPWLLLGELAGLLVRRRQAQPA
jgi:hypothetical protein